ncbi:MAG: GNAT family N-acyltransferase, partial [Desulfocapsaceae bacterium]
KRFLKRLLHEQAFVDFAQEYPHLQGIEFVEQVLEYFNFSYAVSDRERENIPPVGKVVIIANHPIGSLDGLALLKLIHEVRSDVKVVANDLLMSLEPLQSLLLPVRVLTGVSTKEHIRRINHSLDNEEAVIMFPSGEVSRLGLSGIKDGAWHQGFLKMAERAKAPILPVHIGGHNSPSFYLASLLAKPLSTLMLVGQMFNQKEKQIAIKIGSIIPYESCQRLQIRNKEKIELFKNHLYRIGSGKSELISTEKSIARPERKKDLRKAVHEGSMLGRTPDGKAIFLFEAAQSSPVLREIGRLRELSFRAVGEGSGKRRDLDHFDHYYQHLILWDEDDLEIAGAYRFVDAGKVVAELGAKGLYSGSLFKLEAPRSTFLENGLELGRSFVQPRYWGKRSLDYLWYGIGAYLVKNPHFRFLFGPVSISNAQPGMAKELLIYFYKLYFSPDARLSCSRNPFRFSQPMASLEKEFCGTDYKADFRKLKSLLANLGTTVPPLYKQYTGLCEPGGVVFLDFNIDPAFNNCVDGLVIVDIKKLKEAKRKRYMDETILV